LVDSFGSMMMHGLASPKSTVAIAKCMIYSEFGLILDVEGFKTD
jgi:hypothetical protein